MEATAVTEKLGDRLRKLRLSKGTSQEETAAVFNVPKQTWSNWEVGAASPKLDMLVKLATYFNVTTDYLLGVEKEAANIARMAADPASQETIDLIARMKASGLTVAQIDEVFTFAMSMQINKKTT
jgi:transcriptional regulator with XRE-family HTH domain